LSTAAAEGSERRNAALPKFVPVPLAMVPVKGMSSARSSVPQVFEGCDTSPEPEIVPRLYSRFWMSRSRVPSTSMLSWLRVRPLIDVYG
jgi:hypothetical protein